MSVDLEEIGGRLRSRRVALKWSVKRLAQESGLSERYLISAEHGRANLSLQKLACVCEAMQLSMPVLLLPSHLLPLFDLVKDCTLNEVKEVCTTLEQALHKGLRQRKVALLGVRGAGKSTVGCELATIMGYRFVELDHEIERVADISLSELFAWHGEGYYRKLERELLTEVLGKSEPMVIATGGGIVSHPETYAYLKNECVTIWLEASAEHHWSRVVAQGDERPMKDHPHAMAELRALLSSRSPLYGEADYTINTEALHEKAVANQIAEILIENSR